MDKATYKVLVIEDDPVQQTVTSRMLASAQLEAVIASNGEDGLALLDSDTNWLAVLLDLALPGGLSGIDVLLKIRESYTPGQLPVLILSANNQTSVIVEALLLGANEYIVKSQDASIWLARLNVCLALQEQFDQRIDEEQYRVMRETIGAACHHISQPMTAAVAELDLMLSNPDLSKEEILGNLKDLKMWIKQSQTQIHRLQGTRKYKTTHYAGDVKILDIENQD